MHGVTIRIPGYATIVVQAVLSENVHRAVAQGLTL
jgi:hypothetical protein